MASTSIETKRPHRLHGSLGAGAFLQALACEGVDLDEVLSTCLRPDADAGVLLGGSLAEGLGNEAADVDLLVLLDSREGLRSEGEGLSLRSGRALEWLVYRSGIEINLEVFVRSDVERLMESFVSIAPALYDPTELEWIPMLQPFDLRFLHRLRTGWCLRGARLTNRWRDEFLVDLLPTYLTVLNFVTFNEHLEDAVSMLKDHPQSGVYVARKCVEWALQSCLAHAGFTSQNNKWLLRWCDQVADAEVAAFMASGRELLLDGSAMAEPTEYLRKVEDLGRRLLTDLERDPEIRRATDYLRARIKYIDYPSPSPSLRPEQGSLAAAVG
jgi:hypothetical protein